MTSYLLKNTIADILDSLECASLLEKLEKPLCLSINNHFQRRFSQVCHCALRTVIGGNYEIVVKILRKDPHIYKNRQKLEERILCEYDSLCEIGHIFPPNNLFKIPKALCVVPKKHALIVEYVRGVPVEDHFNKKPLILTGGNSFTNIKKEIAMCGDFLGLYHNNTWSNIYFEKHDLKTIQAYLFSKVSVVAELMEKVNLPKKSLLSMKQDIELIMSKPESFFDVKEMLVKCHGDFTPSNLLFGVSEAYLIDFADARNAPKYLDVACFLNYLDMLHLNKPLLNPLCKIIELQEAFLSQYRLQQPMFNNEMLLLFRLRYLLTNLIMQLYDSQKSVLHRLYYNNRINRYLNGIYNVIKLLTNRQLSPE